MAIAAHITNVVQLPTAAPKKVRQRSVRAVREFKQVNPWPGEYVRPEVRDALDFERSPALLIAISIFKVLSAEQQARVCGTVAQTHLMAGDDDSLTASRILARL